MKNKILKLLIVVLLFFIIINIYLSVHNKALALSDITEVPPEFWISGNKDVGEDELNRKAAPILGIIRIFGFIASIITLAIIGIKIMYGGIEEKATYKQTLMPWAIGAVMIFAMTTIPSLVFNVIGEENMEEEMVLSTGKFSGTFCPNGEKIIGYRGDSNGNETGLHAGGKDCEYTKADLESGYGCPKCQQKLQKIGNYYWCDECKIGYE